MAYRGLSSGGGDLDESGMIEAPLFSMRKIDFDLLDPTSVITHAQIANSVLYVFTLGITNDRKLYRKIIGDSSSADFFDLKVEAISKIFVNPLGNLILFTTEMNQTYYFSKVMKKYKTAQKFLKDIQVQCMAFNRVTQNESCQHFLVGSMKGEIISVEYANGELISSKQIYQLTNSFRGSDANVRGADPIPVMSMELILVASDEICVFCASKDRILMFSGQSTAGVLDLGIQSVFKVYSDNMRKVLPLLFSVSSNNSQIHPLYSSQSLTPSKLYWFAGKHHQFFFFKTLYVI